MIHFFSTNSNMACVKDAINDNDHSNYYFCLNDLYADGPLLCNDDSAFQKLRQEYAFDLSNSKLLELSETDLEVYQRINELLENDTQELVYWMSATIQDVMVYYMMLHYLRTFTNKLFVINISGLPFIDDDNKMFFPNQIDSLPKKEIIKTWHLKRKISNSEIETDADEWQRICNENGFLRILSSLKKVMSVPEDYYDNELYQFHKSHHKIATSVQKFINSNNLCLSNAFLERRLEQLILMNKMNPE